MHSTFVAVFFSLFFSSYWVVVVLASRAPAWARAQPYKKETGSFLFHTLVLLRTKCKTPLGQKPKSPRLLESSFKSRRGKPTYSLKWSGLGMLIDERFCLIYSLFSTLANRLLTVLTVSYVTSSIKKGASPMPCTLSRHLSAVLFLAPEAGFWCWAFLLLDSKSRELAALVMAFFLGLFLTSGIWLSYGAEMGLLPFFSSEEAEEEAEGVFEDKGGKGDELSKRWPTP